MLQKIKNPYAISMALAVAVLLIVLIAPLGVGEGGSQYILLERVGLTYQKAPQPGVVDMTFKSSNKVFAPANTHEFFISILNFLPGFFDLRVMGIVYSILLLFGISLMVKNISKDEYEWHTWLTALFIVFLFCDFAYTTYFNSFYWNPLFMVLLVLIAGCFLSICKSGEASLAKVIALFVCISAFAFINTLTAILAAIIGIVIIRLFLLGKSRAQKTISLICGIIIILQGIYFAITYTSPSYEIDLYNAVFLGTANYESVTELGLDQELDELKGVFYSEEINQEYKLKQNFYNKINYHDIIKFYLTHPNALWGIINAASSNGFNIRLAYAGNFTSPDLSGSLANGFNIYSFLKSKMIPNTFVFVLLVFILYFSIIFSLYFNKNTTKRRKVLLEALLGLGVGALISFIMPCMQTGMVDIGRSMFVFYLLFDFMIITAVLGGSILLMERRQALRDKYGVRQ